MDILKRIPYYGVLTLLAYMPFHIFLSQSISLVTGGLEAWKIAKDVILLLLAVFTICLVFWQGKATSWFKSLIGLTALYGVLHLLIWLLNPDIYQRTAILGMVYNMRLLVFAVLGAGAMLLLPKFAFSSLMKFVLGISTAVAILGIIQYFLPADFLTHFGYSLDRGVRPAFSIDDNINFPRIMSTLREPNALAAYLLVPIAALTAVIMRYAGKKRLLISLLLSIHLLAMALTQSRSGWIATVVVITVVVWWQHREWLLQQIRRFWLVIVLLLLTLSVAVFSVRNTHFFQQYIIHSNSQETVTDLDSNDLHIALIRQGLSGVEEQPLGHGPGTAGVVSIQNPTSTQLTENYYVQIAYEVGIIGAALFISISIWLYIRIMRRQDIMAVILCASFLGYIVTNMLLHTWSNEAVAAQWWLLAGMALGIPTDSLRLVANQQD